MRATLALFGGLAVAAGTSWSLGLVAAAMPAPGPQAAGTTPPAAAAAPATANTPQAKAAAPSAPAGASEAESKPVVALVDAFVKAYNVPDAEAMAALFTDEGAVVDSEGGATRGRAEVAAMYAAAFQDVPGLKLESSVESVRFLTPDVAQVEGESRLAGGAAGDAVTQVRYHLLALRKDGRWKIAELRDDPVPEADVTPYDRLRELEWMVGDWVDESETSRVTASIKWADNQSYLVRTYSVEIQGERQMTGTMFIGWDPQTRQIKSWVFDSQGGHGEGLWTRAADDQWIVKAHGVMRDGRPSSATQIHTILNNDSVKTASIDRIIGGEIAPDVPEIVMVRRPPPPGAPATSPAPAPAPAPGSGGKPK